MTARAKNHLLNIILFGEICPSTFRTTIELSTQAVECMVSTLEEKQLEWEMRIMSCHVRDKCTGIQTRGCCGMGCEHDKFGRHEDIRSFPLQLSVQIP